MLAIWHLVRHKLSPCVITEQNVVSIIYLGQVLLNDIVPHLRCIQLRVESSANHRHNVIDAAQASLFSQQIPAHAQKHESLPSGELESLDTDSF